MTLKSKMRPMSARRLGRGLVCAAAVTLAAACTTTTNPLDAPPAKPGAPVAGAPAVKSEVKTPAWSALHSASAQPVWPAGEIPAGVTAVPVERLDALTLGMNQEAVTALLGAPHGTLKGDEGAGEVWQYVVRDDAGSRAFIASLWFGPRGLWLASGRSRAVGQLAAMKFGNQPIAAALVHADQVPGAAAPAAPAAAPPASATAAASAPAGDVAAELRATLDDWLEAWRKKDLAAYLAHYVPDFSPVGKKHTAWERERRQRISGAAFVRVSAADVQVQGADGARPRLAFEQSYESESYEQKSRKVLTFVKQGGRWLIEKEENTALRRRKP